jgi:peptide/nickel transport system permease protein
MKTFAQRLWWHRRTRAGLLLVSILVLVAALAPLFAPYDPTEQLDLVTRQTNPPSPAHPFGTDFFSRDVFSRVLYGGRISLAIAFLAVFLSITVGTIVGWLAGIGSRVVDSVLMRTVDAALAIPRIFLLLVVLALWNDVGITALIMILGFTGWFGTSRLVRAEVLSLRERGFIHAAHALGIGKLRLFIRHLLPNLAAPVIVTATLGVGHVILIEAGLSFLGIGVRPPTPSWGSIIQEGQSLLAIAPWIAAFPGFAIVLTVVGFSLLGDGLRDTLDPRSR